MDTLKPLLRLGMLVIALNVMARGALAQDAASSDDDTAPAAAGSTSTDLFPAGTSGRGAGNVAGPTGRRGAGHQRNGRRRDLLVSQADTDPLAVRVAYRRAKTVVLARNPDLAQLLREAAFADTDVIKRAYLKQYYTRLFAGVCKVDTTPEMKSHVDLLMRVAEQRYDPKRREVGGDEDLVNGGGRGRRGRVQ